MDLVLSFTLVLAFYSAAVIKFVNPLSVLGHVFSDKIWLNVFHSVKIVLLGFVLSVSLAFLFVVLSWVSSFSNYVLSVLVDFYRNISSIALYPVIITLFGLDDMARVFVIFWTSFPIIFTILHQSVFLDNTEIYFASLIDGATRLESLLYVIIPSSAPVIFAGLRACMGNAWLTLVAAEMLGGNKGLGFFVLQSSSTFRFDESFAAILVIGVIGFLFNRSLKLLEGFL